MICVIFAHPYQRRSRVNRVLAQAVMALPNVELRSLYDLYPDFDIDTLAEQEALQRSSLIVWMHPIYWYSVPALLKHWFEKVLAFGWAYGDGGTALYDKHCLWVTTTGGDEHAYSSRGMHEQPFSKFIPPIEETARFCGMRWEEPYLVHDAHSLDDAALAEHARVLTLRLAAWVPAPRESKAGSVTP